MEKSKVREAIRKNFKKVEKIELVKNANDPDELVETDYPKPESRHFIILENFGLSAEESYF